METLKADNLSKAIRLLPIAKNYPPETVTVAVGKLKYTFKKIKNEWYYVIARNEAISKL